MSEFVSDREKQRRVWTVAVCVLLDAVFLALGILWLKSASDTDHGPEVPDSVAVLRTTVKQKREEVRQIQEKFTLFSRPVGWTTASDISLDRLPEDTLLGADLERSTGVSQLRGFLDHWVEEFDTMKKEDAGLGRTAPWKSYKKWSDKGGAEASLTVTTLFDVFHEQLEFCGRQIDELDREIDGLRQQERSQVDEREQKDATFKTEIGGRDGGGIIDEYLKLQENFAAQENAHLQERTEAEAALKKELEELTKVRKGALETKADLSGKLAQVNERIGWILHKKEAAAERKDPDGKIIGVEEKLQIAWIDLTHADRIFKGMKFRVYSLEKGGVKQDKGEVEVIEVGKEYSKVAIVRQRGEEALAVEDRIFDEHYERGQPRTIAIAGRFRGKLSNQDAAVKIREFGDLYQDKADEKTTLVVLGEGYEEHPNFKAAQDLGIKLMLEKYLYDYLGVP